MKIAASQMRLQSDRRYRETTMRYSRASFGFGTSLGADPSARSNRDAYLKHDSCSSGAMEEAEYGIGYADLWQGMRAPMTEAAESANQQGTLEQQLREIRISLLSAILNLLDQLAGKELGGLRQQVQNQLFELQGSGASLYLEREEAYYHAEEEITSFNAQGIACTEDGREISFGVDFGMTRRFAESVQIRASQQIRLTDPLIIHVGEGVDRISDQKFLFDLDSDGVEEEISMPGEGSGFLALDRNGDGRIGDGSELFGTDTGDGFAELSGYDQDGNGWIDENDEIYDRLRVYCLNADGSRVLLNLKQADVGAIYLGSVETQFTQQGADFEINGITRSSGIYLKESGGAGLVQQVDLASKKQNHI